MNIPLIRAFHKPSQSFISDGWLTLENHFLVAKPNELPVPLADVEIDLFTGKISEAGQPVYQNDVLEIETPNEFGSVVKDIGVVRYMTDKMCYMIVSEGKFNSHPLPTKIVRVIGHKHD